MTTKPSAADELRWSACCHEAGHAWAWHALLGGTIGVVSVRAAAGRHAGITIGDPAHPVPYPCIDGTALDGLDPAERRLGDRWLVLYLVGDEAEDALELWTPTGGFGQPIVEAPPPTLTPAVAALFAEAEVDTRGEPGTYNPKTDPNPADARAALELAVALVGPDTASPYLGWARAEARLAARTHARPAIHALASALWREAIIGGPGVAAIFDAHERSTHA